MFLRFAILSLSILICVNLSAQADQQKIIENLDKKADSYAEIAHQIWGWAEMGYLEEKSSALLQKTLEDEGFSIKSGVAEIPTAFIAEYGSGSPVIAILG